MDAVKASWLDTEMKMATIMTAIACHARIRQAKATKQLVK